VTLGAVELTQAHGFVLRISTPAMRAELHDVLALRFAGPSGARGVLRGHEPAVARIEAGVLRATRLVERGAEEVHYAVEDGLVWMQGGDVMVFARWADGPASLEALRQRLATRTEDRARVELELVETLHRHERATQRALAKLRRDVES
jgi:F0F1-type ATP synthase epsilon subunit